MQQYSRIFCIINLIATLVLFSGQESDKALIIHNYYERAVHSLFSEKQKLTKDHRVAITSKKEKQLEIEKLIIRLCGFSKSSYNINHLVYQTVSFKNDCDIDIIMEHFKQIEGTKIIEKPEIWATA